MTLNRKTTIRYSLSFKQQVVKELEAGESMEVLKRRYGIRGGQTIQEWVRKFGKDHLLNKIVRVETIDEKDRMKLLEEENKKLKLALADSLLAQRSLEVVIAEANKEYKTDLKKNFGDSASTSSEKSSQ
jgi:transposase-like protein